VTPITQKKLYLFNLKLKKMPINPLDIGIPVLNQIGNYIQQGVTNRKNQQLVDQQNLENRRATDLQYERSINEWHRTNKYNSPAEQMKRYQEAGLNPNLIYGQGTPGNASSTISPQAPRIEKAQYGLPKMDVLNNYVDLRQKNAQIDNIEQATIQTKAKTEGQNLLNQLIDQNLISKTRGNQVGQQYDLAKAEADLGLKYADYDIKKATEKNLEKDNEIKEINRQIGVQDLNIKEYAASLRKYGIMEGDPLWLRAMIIYFKERKEKMPDTMMEGFKEGTIESFEYINQLNNALNK